MKKHALTAGVAFLVAHARADNYCASGLQHSSSGQPFCKAVDRIAYTNFGTSGSYNKVVSMDTAAGTCTSEPFSFSGSLAPLNEEVCSFINDMSTKMSS